MTKIRRPGSGWCGCDIILQKLPISAYLQNLAGCPVWPQILNQALEDQGNVPDQPALNPHTPASTTIIVPDPAVNALTPTPSEAAIVVEAATVIPTAGPQVSGVNGAGPAESPATRAATAPRPPAPRIHVKDPGQVTLSNDPFS